MAFSGHFQDDGFVCFKTSFFSLGQSYSVGWRCLWNREKSCNECCSLQDTKQEAWLKPMILSWFKLIVSVSPTVKGIVEIAYIATVEIRELICCTVKCVKIFFYKSIKIWLHAFLVMKTTQFCEGKMMPWTTENSFSIVDICILFTEI